MKEENLLSQPVAIGDKLDLRWVQRHEIIKIEDRKFISISKPGNFHGLALWFDVESLAFFSDLSYSLMMSSLKSVVLVLKIKVLMLGLVMCQLA